MAREVELKFDVEPGAASAIRNARVLAAILPEAQDHDSLYFDTADSGLRRAGYSLRVRRSGRRFIQTVKSRKPGSAGLFVRREWESEVPRFALDRGALNATPLRRWLASEDAGDLVPLIRTRFRRTRWLVDHAGSRIEVVLDEGTVAHGKRRAPLDELELELLSGNPADLFALAEDIAAAAPLRLSVQSKADRGYALADGKAGRAAKAEPIRLQPAITQAAAFHTIALGCMRHFRLNESVLLEERSAEALHQARVALRRLRSALSLFRPAVRGKAYQGLREDLRWFAGQFSDARNLDVLLERVGDQDPELAAALREARDKAYRKVGSALRSDKARALMLRLSIWLETGAWRSGEHGARDLAELAERQLERRWKRIRRHGDDLGHLDAEARHRLRLDIKKLRYAAEFLAPLATAKPLSARRDRFIGALKTLQEKLGLLNDAWTAEQLAARLPRALRRALSNLHTAPESRHALAAAERAMRRAMATAGYWQKVVD